MLIVQNGKFVNVTITQFIDHIFSTKESDFVTNLLKDGFSEPKHLVGTHFDSKAIAGRFCGSVHSGFKQEKIPEGVVFIKKQAATFLKKPIKNPRHFECIVYEQKVYIREVADEKAKEEVCAVC